MTVDEAPPAWRMPRGVNSSLWQYANSPRIAEDEEHFFAGHPLFTEDRKALDARFVTPSSLVDLGCGAGRLSLHFARRGFEVTAVELSRPMLKTLGSKADSKGLVIRRVRANLCDLGCFPDGSFNYALSMFSTLGMIRGKEAREKALRETFRVLQPGGRLALHAHNLYLNLDVPQGRKWLLGQLGKRLLRRPDAGDRRMTYRGIPDMEVHLFRWRELRSMFKRAGFRIDEVLAIDAIHAKPIASPWFWPGLRAGGWIIFASRPHKAV